jgi:hypothetical protein
MKVLSDRVVAVLLNLIVLVWNMTSFPSMCYHTSTKPVQDGGV